MTVDMFVSRRFEKDLSRFDVKTQERVRKKVDRLFESVNQHGDLGPRTMHVMPVMLRKGLSSSLRLFRITHDLRVLLSLDEDPLFDRRILTLLAVTKQENLSKTLMTVSESLYQNQLREVQAHE